MFWKTTHNPDTAIGFSILADLLAGIPTFRKAWQSPETENGATFIIYTLALSISLLCVQDFTFTSSAFLIYLFCTCLLVSLIIYRAKISLWITKLFPVS